MIKYKKGKPKSIGVYACRIPLFETTGLLEDRFLFFDGIKWHYISSDQKYRGKVLGWIGPLQRRIT